MLVLVSDGRSSLASVLQQGERPRATAPPGQVLGSGQRYEVEAALEFPSRRLRDRRPKVAAQRQHYHMDSSQNGSAAIRLKSSPPLQKHMPPKEHEPPLEKTPASRGEEEDTHLSPDIEHQRGGHPRVPGGSVCAYTHTKRNDRT